MTEYEELRMLRIENQVLSMQNINGRSAEDMERLELDYQRNKRELFAAEMKWRSQ